MKQAKPLLQYEAQPARGDKAIKANSKIAFSTIFGMLPMVLLNTHVAHSAGFEMLKPHRAVYDVKLDKASERSGIASMKGRIVYEMSGNACDGISVRYRFVADVNANGKIIKTDQQSASFENSNGKEYSFFVRSEVNERLDKELRGVALAANNGLTVNLSSPNEREVKLQEAVFSSAHLVKVLKAAAQGTTFFKQDVFDAGDDADKVLKTTNIIGKKTVTKDLIGGEKLEAIKAISSSKAWPVNIGYFGKVATKSSEQVAEYEISFLLYDGGISRNLSMRYPEYSITGSLVSLEMLEVAECKN